MEDPRSADVIASQDHQIDGRQVDVKKAVPRASAPPPSRNEAKKLFVGGLHADVDDKEFCATFGKFGNVVDGIVMVDRVTQRSRGFGFVTFDSEEAVRAVLRTQVALALALLSIQMRRALLHISLSNITRPLRLSSQP